MHGWMGGRGNALGSPWFIVVAGIIVLTGAVMLYFRSDQRRSWGVVILVVSGLEILLGMMGLLAARWV